MLPKWKSHKIVSADRIIEVRDVGVAHRAHQNDSGQRWVLACGEVIEVSHQLLNRLPDGYAHKEALGGYYIRYADGFESWSPPAAFENGYDRMPQAEGTD